MNDGDRSIETSLLRNGHYIDGHWRGSSETYPVYNPATGSVVAEVAKGGRAEAQEAVDAAAKAFPAWRALTAKERSSRMRRWGELMLVHREALAELLSREQGKPLAEARGEVAYAASFLEWFAEEAKRAYGDVIPSPSPHAKILVVREPIGVVAAITPWNFPLAMITRKAAPALAAGCTMVLKPSEETPLSAFALAVLAELAEIPAGVFNIVSGDAIAIGTVLTGSSIVRKLSFTGSTRTGKLLARQCSDTLKKLSLELGGNAPFIVFDDADIDAAVRGAIASKFRNTGQTCVCVNRFYVQNGIYKAFTQALVDAVSRLRVGDALAGDFEQGPLINRAALIKVQEHVADAVVKGARVLMGGKPHALGGTFFEPTVLVDATHGMLIAQEETFGPVAACFRFDSEEEVVTAANGTPYGLAAYFYTRDIARSWRVAGALESGMVGINEGIISTEVAPFGGVKESGLGREGSKYGIDEYMELKYLMLGGLDG
ncbi:NAD-dependent succinate-semialdehyde dehydrogenase [Dyella nitratireducens]|uniref:Glutarate-semialdehyde dehydrogenase DavD n=1 Tax=Dyella nitratireducens TaxID=1849580 RepID=A0ABQ1FQV6_9GAMM|nr:NAD-dependent succinate-semialdehyde dehydrogenase [Dyella nitratireducens]GGA24336.1 glutarate-semialdehyde dehydrogenase DavD [Dyella nitratireducens]GLQ43838.1 glutarate-semialdehyde dehydrogenase DavD [Dyella nitratireducens]